MRHKRSGGLNSCVSGFQSGPQSQLVRCCLTALLWLAATATAQGFGHHIELAGKALPLSHPVLVFLLHVSATCLTPNSAPGIQGPVHRPVSSCSPSVAAAWTPPLHWSQPPGSHACCRLCAARLLYGAPGRAGLPAARQVHRPGHGPARGRAHGRRQVRGPAARAQRGRQGRAQHLRAGAGSKHEMRYMRTHCLHTLQLAPQHRLASTPCTHITRCIRSRWLLHACNSSPPECSSACAAQTLHDLDYCISCR